MFYRFFVKPEHRDYLRFFWFQDNNPDLPMIEYRMTVHVFGNRLSPAVATYGLREAVKNSEEDIREFVNKHVYVDDALTSLPTADMAVSLLKRTRETLRDEGNIRLHKIASNDKTVMSQFSKEDLGKDLKDLDIGDDSLPLQHSLGLTWNLNTDSIVFTAPVVDNPFTRRGLLSAVSSIFDPIGFLSPFTVSGRMLLRKACPEGIDWDETLPDIHKDSWQTWTQNLNLLNGYQIPRMYAPTSLSLSKNHGVLIYSDASEKAVAAAAFLQMTDMNDQYHLGFVMGKAKLAPQAGHSIPRLELCGAVLATEIGQFVAKQLDILPSKMKYSTDSKVVLGYIKNKTRRFYTYVSNRVSLIQQFTSCDQWNYVPSHLNPVDAATRDSSMDILSAINVWLKGPEYILRDNELLDEDSDDFPLIEPENDKEICPVQVLKSTILTYKPVSERFTHHSSWNRLVNAFTVLRHITRSYRKERNSSCKGWHLCKESKSSEAFEETQIFLLKQTQKEYFKCETDNLKQGLPIKKDSSIISLSPYLDEQGILRVGGRLNRLRSKLGLASTNPIIVPKGHVATLLIRHFHEKTFHQGRKITEGEIRSNGFWIIGAKRLISTLIRTCVLCRKLRGKVEVQKMADLPEDRLTPGPPFSAVGVDTFGPWNVTTRRTRGGAAQSKRWAIIFTCLTTRAVHIELVEEMSSSSFINALRRITAIRGPIKIFRSDRGTNFIGATDQIGITSINVEDTKVKQHLDNTGSVWKFNSPHSSHMGGVWERMIGITRRILDGILLQQNKKALTHEVLSTLMAEVSAVINSRPITTISSDPESPIILSPNILLTQKQGEVPTISGEFSIKDIYTADWKHVQVLSDMFWNKWQENYLQELQSRQKWCIEKPNIKLGDIVFVKDKGLARNDWPVGVVEEAINSDDNLVRKAVVRIYHEGKHVSYTRPITELVLLLEE